MSRVLVVIAAVLALLATALSAYVWTQFERPLKEITEAILQLKTRADASERQIGQLRQQITALQTSTARTQVVDPADRSLPPIAETATSPLPPQTPDGPVTTSSMRDVVVVVEQCSLSNRTLRCNIQITNQSGAEKKFILGIGGKWSRFENEHGGASVFDDIGNDFLSAGGGVGNRSLSNCDSSDACTVEKILTPGVKTPAWVRFDAVDPKATTVKLLRLKWSDGDAWVPMDFRNIPLTK